MEKFKDIIKDVDTSSYESVLYSYDKFIQEMSNDRGFNPLCVNYSRFVTDTLNLKFKTKQHKEKTHPILINVFLKNHHLLDNYSQNIIYDYLIQNKIFSTFLNSLSKKTAQLIIEKQISKYSNISKLIDQNFDFKKYDSFYKHKENLNFYERTISVCAKSSKSSIKYYLFLMEKFHNDDYPLSMYKVLSKLKPENVNFFKYSKLSPFIHDYFSKQPFEFNVAKKKFSLSVHDFIFYQYAATSLSSLVSHGFVNLYEKGGVWKSKITSSDEYYIFQSFIQERPTIKDALVELINTKATKANKPTNKAYWLNFIMKPKEEFKNKSFKI